MKSALFGLLALVALVTLPALANATADLRSDMGPEPATALVIFGADTVVAEIAQTPAERNQGLMHREYLPENAGMLFVFPDAAVRSFWMQNTYLPLDIAYMDPNFRIIDIQPMEPMTTTSVTSRGPAMYALEVNQGWFEEHGVTVGVTPQVVFGN